MRLRTALLLVVVAVLVVAVYAGSFLLFTTKDRSDQLDSQPLREVAAPACTDLRLAVEALPPLPADAGQDDRLAQVDEQRALVDRFVARVREVGDAALDADEPARAWLADWQQLIDTREDWANGPSGVPYAVPVEDGQPITRRMNAIGVDACTVPAGLTSPS